MNNTKENRKALMKKQFTEFGKSCYIICTSYTDKAEELVELPVVNYRAAAHKIADDFRKNHPGFCICSVCFSDGNRSKCFGA